MDTSRGPLGSPAGADLKVGSYVNFATRSTGGVHEVLLVRWRRAWFAHPPPSFALNAGELRPDLAEALAQAGRAGDGPSRQPQPTQ